MFDLIYTMRPNKQNISPCKAIRWQNKLFLVCIKNSIKVLSFLLLPNRKKTLVFEENPKSMTWKDILYFGYKYYVKNNNNFSAKPNFLSFKNGPIHFFEKNDNEKLTLNIAGDLMPYSQINSKTCGNLWTEKIEFFDADIVVANLETPIDLHQDASQVPELMLSNMNFNCTEEQFEIMNGRGFDVLSVANNHTLDMGYKGAHNTKAYLNKKGIQTCGVGNINQTHCVVSQKGFKIGFISYTYSLNQFEVDLSKDLKVNLLPLNKVDGCSISAIRKEAKLVKEQGAEFVVLLIHTGNAYQIMPGSQTQVLMKNIAEESEIDFIVGGHPHNIQPIELFNRNGKSIPAAYSLGDFIAYDIYQRCHLSLYLSIELNRINGKVVLQKLAVNPCYMEYKSKQMRLLDFNKLVESKKNDKKIADLHQLYTRTILEPNA